MTKYYFNLLALIALVSSLNVFNSCTDGNHDKIPDTSSGNGLSESDANALVNAVYGPLQRLSSSYTFLVESATETAISFEEADDSKDGPQVSVLETTPSNWYPIKVFSSLYQSISAANLAIDSVQASSLIDSIKNLYIARALFIRGYDYFQLVQLFGEVPLILTSNPTAEERTTRRSIDDVYNQVITDLTNATAHLPYYSSLKPNPTQLAAKTILAKAYLTWGQIPLSQTDVETIKSSKVDPAKPAVNTAYLQQAAALADEVISSGKYCLLPDFYKIWGDDNGGSDNENNDEVIFSVQHKGDGIDVQGNHQTHCGFTWPKDERKDPHISYADISFQNALPDNDKRKLFSYVTSVSYSDNNIDTLTWPLSIVRPGKWIHRLQEDMNLASDYQPNDIDHIDFRLAEVYLIKAEAAFLLGNTSEALQAINAVRERAGVADLTTLTAQDLYNEWSYEFAFEQKHWQNLVRWHTLISTILEKVPTFEYYKEAYNDINLFKALPGADESRFAFYQRVYKHLHSKVNHIDGHFYRFPIPLSESYTDLGITPQNPGY